MEDKAIFFLPHAKPGCKTWRTAKKSTKNASTKPRQSKPKRTSTFAVTALTPPLQISSKTPIATEKNYEEAIRLYTEAIKLNPNAAAYYANRSIANLRKEYYGDALADATRAVDLDRAYVKGYYRRAAANMAMGRFKASLKDFETVVT